MSVLGACLEPRWRRWSSPLRRLSAFRQTRRMRRLARGVPWALLLACSACGGDYWLGGVRIAVGPGAGGTTGPGDAGTRRDAGATGGGDRDARAAGGNTG